MDEEERKEVASNINIQTDPLTKLKTWLTDWEY